MSMTVGLRLESILDPVQFSMIPQQKAYELHISLLVVWDSHPPPFEEIFSPKTTHGMKWKGQKETTNCCITYQLRS